MKTKLLLVSFLCGSFAVSAQKVATQVARVGKNNVHVNTGSTQNHVNFSNRDVFYTNTFSNPSDWVFENQPGTNPQTWQIGTTGPTGSFLIDPIESTTASDGFALFDSDLHCGGNQVANLTLANGIDCSAQAEVLLSFEQQYRRFFDSTFVFVSNDDGVNWTKFSVNTELGNNDYCDGSPSGLAQVYITPVAAYQANVKIRFQFYSPSSLGGLAGCAYSWMVDDVTLSTPLQNNVTINQVYAASIVTDYDMGLIPLSQADTVQSTVVVANNGYASQDVVLNYSIKRNGTEVNAGSSPATTVGGFTVTSIDIVSNYVPDQIGNYTIEVTAAISATDEDPSDNAGSNGFEVTDNLFSAVADVTTTTALDLNASTTVAPPYDTYRVGQNFFIRNATELTAFEISPARIAADAATGNVSVDIELFDDADLTAPLALENFVVTSTHAVTPAWYTVALSSPVSMDPGIYVASMGNFDDTKNFAFNVAAGDDDIGTICYGPFGAGGAVDWYIGWDFSPAIALNFDPTIGFDAIEGGDNLVVSPNPANDVLNINLNLAKASNVQIDVIDMNGKVVFNKNIKANLIGYKEELSLAGFANGIYTVQVRSANGTSSQKVVVAH
ncbi:MAG: T9SS type A sorting domain-containing protein [Bacteroidia bacterium]|jgi:hypothetical protein